MIKRPAWRGLAGGGTSIAFVVGLLVLLGLRFAKTNSGPRDSGPAPNFTLTGYDGRKVTLSELRGQVVVINFWASWCLPCRQEADYLEQTWREYQSQGVVFIGVDNVDTETEARAFLQEFDIS